MSGAKDIAVAEYGQQQQSKAKSVAKDKERRKKMTQVPEGQKKKAKPIEGEHEDALPAELLEAAIAEEEEM